jgi:ubiquinone/menaquinone biosynthesis C-methylase UbiE
VGTAVAARYASARPALHDRAVALIRRWVPPPDRALDVGCGTGLSTRALADLAEQVVGVDVSEEMLHARESDSRPSYVRATAERLPFADATFDLATIASAIHWFDRDAAREVARVLRPSASLVVYDVWFPAQMVGVEEFHTWTSTEMGTRYRSVPKNEFHAADLPAFGFNHAWREDIEVPVQMSHVGLVDYLMTHSERIAAVAAGQETEDEQRDFLARGSASFFDGKDAREMTFGIWVEAFDR